MPSKLRLVQTKLEKPFESLVQWKLTQKGEVITLDMLRKHSEAPSDEAIAGL